MSTLEETIFSLIKKHSDVSPSSLVSLSGLSRSVVQKCLKDLLDGGFVEKRGVPPRVYYRAVDDVSPVIQEHFLYKEGDTGGLLFGMEGFRVWANDRFGAIDFQDKVALYEEAVSAYQRRKVDGLFFAMDTSLKIPEDFVALSSLACLDLYTMEISGDRKRTKEAVLLEVVKGSGNPQKLKDLVQEYISFSVRHIHRFAEQEGVDAVAFIPPTAKRDVQVMHLLRSDFLRWNARKIPEMVIRRDFSASDTFRREQKSISNVKNRIGNADKTYKVLPQKDRYKKLLLVDDLVGSGATLHTVARKIKEQGIADKVLGLCLVGINSKKLVVVRKV